MVDGEPRRSVTVDFQILDYLDGGTGLIIYEGDPKAEFQVTGVIEGVGQIETNATISPRRLWVEYIRGLTGLVGLVISFLAVALFVKLPDWLRRAPIPKPLQSVGALLGKIFLFLTLALSIAGVFWILILDPFLKARTRFQENIAHRVPAHILPRK